MVKILFRWTAVAIAFGSLAAPVVAQTQTPAPAPPASKPAQTPAQPPPPAKPAQAPAQPPPAVKEGVPAKADPQAPAGVQTPPGYVIGADDSLSVRFWGDEQLSADVVVRPDGKISVPLLNDVQAAGFTPEQLSAALEKAASKYITDPDATVIVREVRSRKVFVLGQVGKPSPVPLNTDMNVLQVLTTVGGLLEYADKSNITIFRTEGGKQQRFRFNYNEVVNGRNLEQNILLKPGDTIVVK